MTRFIVWVLVIGITLAFRGQLIQATIWAGKSAGHALQHEQMSYRKFTKTLLTAKPTKIRPPPPSLE